MKVYNIWCEYDFNGNICSNSGVYVDVDKQVAKINEMFSCDDMTLEELIEEGMAGIEELEIE